MSVSIIIPAHNVEKTIYSFVNSIKSIYKDAQIIVLEDGSTDKTKDIIKKFKAKNIHVYTNKERLGKGKALINGFEKATGDKIIFIDADMSIHPTEIQKIIDALDTFDVVIGSRRINGAVIVKDQKLLRKFFGLAYRWFVHILFGLKFLDTQCGLKGFRRYVYDKIKPLKMYGWSLDLELVLKSIKAGFIVKEVPIVWSDSESSSLNPISAGISMFLDLLKLKKELNSFYVRKERQSKGE